MSETEVGKAPKLVVPCKGCTFALWEGKTQTGCAAGRLEKFRALGLVTDCRDEENEFAVLGRACNLRRLEGTASVEECLDRVRPRLAVVCVMGKASLEDTVAALEAVPAPEVVLVRPHSHRKSAPAVISALRDSSIPCWEMSDSRLPEATHADLIGMGVARIKAAHYYAVIGAGLRLPAGAAEALHRHVNIELAEAMCYESESNNWLGLFDPAGVSWHGLVVSLPVHAHPDMSGADIVEDDEGYLFAWPPEKLRRLGSGEKVFPSSILGF